MPRPPTFGEVLPAGLVLGAAAIGLTYLALWPAGVAARMSAGAHVALVAGLLVAGWVAAAALALAAHRRAVAAFERGHATRPRPDDFLLGADVRLGISRSGTGEVAAATLVVTNLRDEPITIAGLGDGKAGGLEIAVRKTGATLRFAPADATAETLVSPGATVGCALDLAPLLRGLPPGGHDLDVAWDPAACARRPEHWRPARIALGEHWVVVG